MFPRIPRPLALALAAIVLAVAAAAPTASAHASKTSEDGRIKVTWGWLHEPALSKTANGLDLRFRYAENDTGITGLADAGLNVTIRYNEETRTLDGIQAQHGREAEGRYTGLHPITPSKGGLYVLHVRGTVAGSEVDVEIPASHPVDALEETYFPPASEEGGAADISALEARIAALEAKVAAQSESPADVTPQDTGGNATPGPGALAALAAMGVVAVTLALRRRA